MLGNKSLSQYRPPAPFMLRLSTPTVVPVAVNLRTVPKSAISFHIFTPFKRIEVIV